VNGIQGSESGGKRLRSPIQYGPVDLHHGERGE